MNQPDRWLLWTVTRVMSLIPGMTLTRIDCLRAAVEPPPVLSSGLETVANWRCCKACKGSCSWVLARAAVRALDHFVFKIFCKATMQDVNTCLTAIHVKAVMHAFGNMLKQKRDLSSTDVEPWLKECRRRE